MIWQQSSYLLSLVVQTPWTFPKAIPFLTLSVLDRPEFCVFNDFQDLEKAPILSLFTLET